jgi:hypothetical protein
MGSTPTFLELGVDALPPSPLELYRSRVLTFPLSGAALRSYAELLASIRCTVPLLGIWTSLSRAVSPTFSCPQRLTMLHTLRPHVGETPLLP